MRGRAIFGSALILLLTVGCGGDSDATDDRPPGIDSAVAAFQDSVASAATMEGESPSAPGAVAGDSLITTIKYRCRPKLIASASYWIGPDERVVLGLVDTVMTLPRAISADGARYALENPALEWWEKGDSAWFTRKGQRYSCWADSTALF